MSSISPEELIQQAIEDAIRSDEQQKPRKKLLTTSERNITSYLRASLEAIIRTRADLKHYQVDMEYNRQGDGNESKSLDGRNVVPDIIIHKRGVSYEEDKEANYLCIEIKVISGFNGHRSSLGQREMQKRFDADKQKLGFAQSEKHYRHAAFLILNEKGECFLEMDHSVESEDGFKRLLSTRSSGG